MQITSTIMILKHLDFLEKQTYLININSQVNDTNEYYFKTFFKFNFYLYKINNYINVNSLLPVRSLHIQNPCS